MDSRRIVSETRHLRMAAILALSLLAFLSLAGPVAGAPWFDPAWSYRRAVTVSNLGQALGGYQVKIGLDASFDFSRARPDGADLRVVAADAQTPVPFWVEEWDPAAHTATIWARLSSVAVGAGTIYLYYGNTSASPAASGSATFSFFDDFSGVATSPGVYGNWPRVVVDPYLDGAHNVSIEQVDGDGKADIVADGYRAGTLVWYEQPADPIHDAWSKRAIDSDLGNAHDHQIGDIDGDGRRDVVALSLSETWANYSQGEGYVAWYQKPADPRGAISSGWTPKQPLPSPLADAGAAVYGDMLYIFGGHHLGGVDPQDYCYRYDPATNTWAPIHSLSSKRWGQLAVTFGDRIHLFAGSGTNLHEIYDPATDSWSTAGNPVPAEIADHGLMGVRDGSVIRLFRGSANYEYNPTTDTWARKADVPTPRVWGTCALVSGKVYLIGGGPSGAGRANEAYDPATDTWQTKTPMPVDRWGATREDPVIGGIIYVTHGMISSFYATNYAYDPATDTWSQKSSGLNPRDGVGCGVIDGKLYLVGGRDDDLLGGTGRDFVEAYDPAADTGPGGWRKTIIAHSGDYGLLGARSAGLGDIDGDGDLDIAVAVDGYERHATGQLFWYQNPGGAAALDAAQWHQYLIDATPGNGADAQIGDIDGDGRADIAYCSHAGAPQFTFIYFAPPNPTDVAGWQRMTVAGGSYHAHLVDFDGDGDLDILKASIAEGRVTWLENPGGTNARTPANWIERTLDSGGPIPRFNRVTALDIDGDGDLDVGVETNTGTGGAFKWYRRPADPRNMAAWQIYTIDDNAHYTAYAHDADFGDIDGDGRPDCAGVGAGVGYGPEYDGNKVMWYPNVETTTATLDPTRWQTSGTPTLANGIVTLSGGDVILRSVETFQNKAFRTRARIASYADWAYMGFNYGSPFVGDYDAMFVGFADGTVRSITSSAHNVFTWGYTQSEGTGWKVWDVGCAPAQTDFQVDGALRQTHTTTIPQVPMAAQINTHTGGASVQTDWALVREYTPVEPGTIVSLEVTNGGPQAPHITSTPVLAAPAGAPYGYAVSATGSPTPQYALVTLPQGMTIDGATGQILWTPGAQQIGGTYPVTVRAVNASGADAQSFSVLVTGSAPAFTSSPPTTAQTGHPYTYAVTATGAPSPGFTLTLAPPGMTIDGITGLITWTPGPTQVGDFPVTVLAANNQGTASQSFSVHVAEALDPFAWRYRRRLVVDNSSNGSALTNYPVRVDLDAAHFDFAHADPQGIDLRFTGDDGAATLAYWRERWDAAASSGVLWVKVPSVPAHGTSIVYLYYGNSTATDRSNGPATFLMFDDFGTPGVVDPVLWSSSSALPVANGAVTVTGNSQFIRTRTQYQNVALRSRARYATYADFGDIGFNSCCVSVGGNDAMFVGFGNGTVTPITSAGGVWTWGPPTSEGTGWKVWDVLWNPVETRFLVDDALRAANTTRIPSAPLSAQFNTNSGSPTLIVDWTLVRPYSPPEPQPSVQAEESMSQVAAVVAPGTCVSTATPCVTVPVVFTRTAGAGARAISVGIQLSPELRLCDPAHPDNAIHQGTWMAGYASAFQIVDRGGGRYQVDQSILGNPCGITTGGQLFTLDVTHEDGDGAGTITVTDVTSRDCVNEPIQSEPGAAATLALDRTGPSRVADLVVHGTGGAGAVAGTRKIVLGFTVPGDASAVEVYRAPFGGYPLYDRAPGTGLEPAAPTSYPPPNPWVRVPGLTGPGTDDPGTRDFWYYVVATKDGCGNATYSSRSGGALDYVLGDVHDGVTDCAGNNLVNGSDIGFLGAHYGETVPTDATFRCLDVGPTTDYYVTSRPKPDGVLDFEDLAVFALDFDMALPPGTARVVPALAAPVRVAAQRDELILDAPAAVTAGERFEVILRLRGTGAIHALSSRLDWDASVAQFLQSGPGDLVRASGAVLLTPQSGTVDAAVLGNGAPGFTGEGELAVVSFRALRDGAPLLRVVTTVARDRANQPVTLGDTDVPVPTAQLATGFWLVFPNPFRSSLNVSFSLARETRVKLVVFDLAGRAVRHLEEGNRSAGAHVATWDGRNDGGIQAAAGLYLVRFEAGEIQKTRRVLLIR
jgi:N-acetylneuraminic acid mutarotase